MNSLLSFLIKVFKFDKFVESFSIKILFYQLMLNHVHFQLKPVSQPNQLL